MIFTISKLKEEFHYWDTIGDMIDQCIDIALNLSQSGHPGGSRSKMPVLLTTLLSGVMRWDIRNPGKTFGDRFVLVAGHTNPVVYAALAVFNESLRRKYKETEDSCYLNPKGDEFTLLPEDLLKLRRRNGLSGHAEMEGKTLFFKYNTGPSGHGSAPAVGQALAMKYAGAEDVKVFAFEGEGGLTTGISHEARISAYGMGVGNLVYVVDWNNFGIDARPFSDIKAGTPIDWFEPYGWQVAGTENGEDWESILNAYGKLFDKGNDNQPKALWVKTRKGRGYLKYDEASHGSPHKRNSKQFWDIRREFSKKLDSNDSLHHISNLFCQPLHNPIYLCGHSLGLQPKIAKKYIQNVLRDWSDFGVGGHHNGESPWFDYHTFLTEPMTKIVGSKLSETVIMNSLTTNLHLLMFSFFKPNKNKYNIIIDTPSFPSDKYAVQSQLKLHKLNPDKNLVEIDTLNNNKCRSNEEILNDLEKNIKNAAMILFSGVNYYTGQFYDIKSIAKLANRYNCVIGLDLAHAAGNVKLNLNKWGVDFAS